MDEDGTTLPDEESGRRSAMAPALSVRTVFAQFWPYTRGYRLRLALGTVLVLVSIPLETLAIWLFKVLVDNVLQPADFSAFPRIAAAYVALSAVMAVIAYAAGQLMTRVSESFVLSIRTRAFEHLQTLSMDFFERRKLGDLLSRLGGDVGAIEALVLSGVSTAASSLLRVLVFGTMLFVLDPLLAASAVVVSPLLWVIGRVFNGRMKAASRENSHRHGALASIAEEALANVGLVQAYNRQDKEIKKFRAEGRGVLRAAMTSSRLRGLYTPLVDLVELAGLMLVIGVGTWQLAQHVVTLGALLVFMAYFSQLYSPLRELGHLSSAMYSASAGAERLSEIMTAQPSIVDTADAEPIDRALGVVEFRGVCFTYPDTDKQVLRDVSFVVRPGQVVAIVGHSGSGKSTVGKLLLRFYDPTAGSLLLDGHDLRRRRLADVREQVAVVMQETLVMDGTIRENILWGRPDATQQQLERAVQAADVDSVAADLPDGLETDVGYRGRRLSGGQRQRVAIARAMIRDAPVLLLDEPATGLDPAAERRIMEPLRRLMAGRTTILITHNLLAAREADLILVMDQGMVVESGTHHQLYAKRGHYYRLHLAQHPDYVSPPSRPTGPLRDVAPVRGRRARAVNGEGGDTPAFDRPAGANGDPVNVSPVGAYSLSAYAHAGNGYAGNGYAGNGYAGTGEPLDGQPVNGEPVNSEMAPLNGSRALPPATAKIPLFQSAQRPSPRKRGRHRE